MALKSFHKISLLGLILLFFFFNPTTMEAQRMNHPSSARAAGASRAASPGGNMSRQGAARPATPPSRPSTSPSSRPSNVPNRQGTAPDSRPGDPGMNNPQRGNINGGAQRSTDRRVNTQNATQDRSINSARDQRNRGDVNRGNQAASDRAGNRTANRGGNDRGGADRGNIRDGNRNPGGSNVGRPSRPGGNNINIGNNNNININAQRNTVVMVNMMHPMMMRPPFMWGGMRVFAFHSFFWFPFSPFFWGPMWHPWGFQTPMLPPQSQVVNVVNETNITNVTNVTNVINEYHYFDGVFYQKDDEGYVVVPAPIGAEVSSIPDNFEKVQVDENEYNYYWGGAYFEETPNGFRVVPPAAGTLVENLSEGGEEVKIGERTLIRFGETYYQPVQVNGKNMYEVVYIEIDEE